MTENAFILSQFFYFLKNAIYSSSKAIVTAAYYPVVNYALYNSRRVCLLHVAKAQFSSY